MKITKTQTAQIVAGIGAIALVVVTFSFVKAHPIYAILSVVAVVAVGVGYYMYRRNA